MYCDTLRLHGSIQLSIVAPNQYDEGKITGFEKQMYAFWENTLHIMIYAKITTLFTNASAHWQGKNEVCLKSGVNKDIS